MTMDYSPCPERKIWPFLRVAISPKQEEPRPPKLVYMHVTSTPTCMKFLSRFRSIKFFDDHGYSPWSSKNLIDRNRLIKFMQVGIDVKFMHTNFDGCGFFGFGDMATFQKRPNFPFGHGL